MLSALIRNIDIDKNQPLQQQLYLALSQLLIQGKIPAGTRLPASRQLAQQWQISRNTVTSVLNQLKAEGFLVSRQGSGVRVNDSLSKLDLSGDNPQQFPLPSLSQYGRQMLEDNPDHSHPSLPLTTGLPDLAAFPDKIWLQLIRHHHNRTRLMGYDGYQGYAPLREAISQYLSVSRGVRCSPEQIILTQGSQEAISLCSQVLLDAGDSVLIENPGYSRARKAFQSRGIDLETIAIGDNGIDLTALPAQTKAKLLYTTPTHQYPLGGILPAPQRLQLLEWAAARNIWLIEDDYDSEFHFYGKPIAAMQGLAAQTPVIYMGSFSKTLLPSLRLGYLVVPKALVSPFVAAKSHLTGESPLLMQAVTADFIQEGHFERHLRRMRLLYQQKWEHMEQLINDQLQGLATAIAESAGMHLCLHIEGIDDIALLKQFNQAGFGGTALSSYYHGAAEKTGLVIGFANSTAEQRQSAIQCLAELLTSSPP